jgi:hypothetical protein
VKPTQSVGFQEIGGLHPPYGERLSAWFALLQGGEVRVATGKGLLPPVEFDRLVEDLLIDSSISWARMRNGE